jgi:hypothetical protein
LPVVTRSPTTRKFLCSPLCKADHPSWDHTDLTTLTADEITLEMTQLADAHQAIIGMSPNYMRPPYLSTNDLVIETIKGLGYLIIEVDIDTQDWAEGPIGEIDLSIQWYEGNQTAGGTLSLNHDPYQPTADTFLPAILSYLSSKGLQSVTVGECLGDDPANWYRGGSVSTTNTTTGATPTGATSPSGSGTPSNGTTTTGGKGGSPPGGAQSGAPSGYPKGSGVPVWNNPPPTSAHGWGNWKPTGAPCGGDTQPGHGPNSGRGALPGHQGQGNNPNPAWNGTSSGTGNGKSSGGSSGGSPGSATGAVSGSHGSGYVSFRRSSESKANMFQQLVQPGVLRQRCREPVRLGRHARWCCGSWLLPVNAFSLLV